MPSVYLSPSLQEYNPYIDGGNEEYYNDIYITQMTSELLESVGEKIDITKNKVTETSSAFFQNAKNFFIKM